MIATIQKKIDFDPYAPYVVSTHNKGMVLENMILSKKSITIFIVCISSLSLGCNEDSTTPCQGDKISLTSSGFVPFKVGNRWIYRFFMFDTLGNQIASLDDTVVVYKDTLINCERWYSIPRFKPTDVDYLDFYTNQNDGIWVRRRISRTNVDTAITYMAFKYPTIEGETWGSARGDSTKTISTQEVIEVPAGTDTCIKYHDHYQLDSSDGISFYYYFAPKKGWVRFDVYALTESHRVYLLSRMVLLKVMLQ